MRPPLRRSSTVTRKRVRACRPSEGVAAKAETWSPSSHRHSLGFPKPFAGSISDRLRIAARTPLRADSGRVRGGLFLGTVDQNRDVRFRPSCFLSHGASCEPLRRFACRRLFFPKQAGKSPHSPFALTIGFVRRFVGDQERPSFLRLDAVIVRGRTQKHPATAGSPSGNCR
jgi:hypothetical protein